MDDPDVFPTKIGNLFWSMMGLIAVAALVSVFIFGPVFIYATPLFILVALLIVFSAYGTKYIFEKDRLIVKCPLTFNEPAPITYASVKKIEDRDIWKVSMGFSSDSVFIYHGKNGLVCISPADKQEFMARLKKSCPQAKFEVIRKEK